MATMRVLPHREADSSAVEWGAWWVNVRGMRSVADSIVRNWDYSTPIAFELQPEFDRDLFLESTGLHDLRICQVVAVAECAATGYRHLARLNLADLFAQDEKVLSINPSPATLAQAVKLSAHVVLTVDLAQADGNVASRRGSRLAQSESTSVQLEGDGARFPTEAISFQSLGLEEALWSLNYDLSQPDEMFASGVRLFINTDHPRAQLLLDGDSPESKLIQSALETDIVRQLMAGAAEVHDVFHRRDWPDGSIGKALESLSETMFGHSLDELIRRRAADMRDFERLLQARTEMFGG